jgi:hypothetical protein|tara:strand:- start:1645 stop:2112 length:468 start_codon:yes stop_codon:yes gene_type:complete
MLIDPITAFAATKSAISLVQQGIKAGKELTDLASPIIKWANAESHIDIHSSNKGKSMFGKFSSIEQNAIAAHLRKMEIKKMQDELREIFLLYAPNGLQQWEMLQKEIANQRKLRKDAIKKHMQEKKKRKELLIIGSIVGIAIIVLIAEFRYIFLN